MNFIKKLFCKHQWRHKRNIYGDEIIDAGYYRSVYVCSKCGKVEYREEMPCVRHLIKQ